MQMMPSVRGLALIQQNLRVSNHSIKGPTVERRKSGEIISCSIEIRSEQRQSYSSNLEARIRLKLAMELRKDLVRLIHQVRYPTALDHRRYEDSR
jgi:hypothetical protein